MNRLRQLEAFRAVMIAGGVTSAAKILNISQPAVSRLIASLEKALNIPLFDRRQGRLHPTSEAEFLYSEVDRAITNLDHVAQLAADIRNQKAGHLRIACLPGFATSLLPKVVAEFLAERPDVTMSIQTRSSARVREWIAAQQYDIGIADEFEGHSAVNHESVNIRTVCALSSRHPLASKQVITARDLDGIPMIVQEVRQFATACLLAEQEAGVAIVSSIDAAEYVGRGLVTRTFEPQLPFQLDILYPKFHPRSLLMQEFIVQFREGLAPFALAD